METVDTAVATVDTAVGKGVRRVEDLVQAAQAEQEQDPEQPQAPKAESPQQNRKFDGRTYEERTLEELRERAAELQLEGRSSMSKDELIAALRNHRKQRSAKNDASKQEPTPDRRTYEAHHRGAPRAGSGAGDRRSLLDEQGRADRRPRQQA